MAKKEKIIVEKIEITAVKTRFYLVLPILTGSTCRNRRYEVEPRTNANFNRMEYHTLKTERLQQLNSTAIMQMQTLLNSKTMRVLN